MDTREYIDDFDELPVLEELTEIRNLEDSFRNVINEIQLPECLEDLAVSAKSFVDIDKKKVSQGERFEFAEFLANSQSLPKRWVLGYITERSAYRRCVKETVDNKEIYTRVRYITPPWTYTERRELRVYMYVGLTKEADPMRRKLAFVQAYPDVKDISDGLYLLSLKLYLSGNIFLDTENINLKSININKERIESLKKKYVDRYR